MQNNGSNRNYDAENRWARSINIVHRIVSWSFSQLPIEMIYKVILSY